jgi:hypothetical protein
MKRYRDLREDSEGGYGQTARVGPLGGNNEVDQADSHIHDIARAGTVDRINRYLGAAAAKPTLDPNSTLRQIQRKLSIIGLQFSIPTSDLASRSRYGFDGTGTPEPKSTAESKSSEYPLTYLGGRFGVLDTSGKIGYDDGISHRLGHGLKLRVEFNEQQTGGTIVIAKIVPSGGSTGQIKDVGNDAEKLDRKKMTVAKIPLPKKIGKSTP